MTCIPPAISGVVDADDGGNVSRQIAEYQAAEYWEILEKYHNSLEAIALRARDEYLGAPAGQADPQNAAVAIAAVPNS